LENSYGTLYLTEFVFGPRLDKGCLLYTAVERKYVMLRERPLSAHIAPLFSS